MALSVEVGSVLEAFDVDGIDEATVVVEEDDVSMHGSTAVEVATRDCPMVDDDKSYCGS